MFFSPAAFFSPYFLTQASKVLPEVISQRDWRDRACRAIEGVVPLHAWRDGTQHQRAMLGVNDETEVCTRSDAEVCHDVLRERDAAAGLDFDLDISHPSV